MKLVLVSMTLVHGKLAHAFRAQKFVKYLTRAGCHVHVVCAGESEQEQSDAAEARIVYHTVPFRLPIPGHSRAARLANRMLSYPEPHVWWGRAAERSLLRRLANDRPDAVIVTSPPHSAQRVGVTLAEKLSLPFVADLRDDWLTNSRTRWHTPLHLISDKHGEERMVHSASAILLNTAIVYGRFCQRYPDAASKFHAITNGYDEDEFVNRAESCIDVSDGRKVLLYAGGSYGGWLTTKLVSLAAEMRRLGLDRTWKIVTASEAENWPPAQFADCWTHLGYLRSEEAAAAMQRAALMLLPMPPGEKCPSGTVPLKAYSYLRAGGGVVYLGERGATSDLLAQFDGTWSVERTVWNHLAEWIIAHDAQLGEVFPRTGIEAYSFANLTNRLLEILRGITGISVS